MNIIGYSGMGWLETPFGNGMEFIPISKLPKGVLKWNSPDTRVDAYIWGIIKIKNPQM
jgi:hypothetical protein